MNIEPTPFERAILSIEESFDRLHAENAQLRASRADLLAASKASILLADKNVIFLDDGVPCRTPECQEIYDRVVAAIAKAESLP